MDIELPSDFSAFLKLLRSHGVEYLLVGGYAVGYHGYARATNDLDIWADPSPENAERLVSAIREFGFDTPELSPELFLHGNRIVRMGHPPMRLEIMTSISGVRFEECYAERVTHTIQGVPVDLISLRHLRINKQAAGRHKDLDDLENLP